MRNTDLQESIQIRLFRWLWNYYNSEKSQEIEYKYIKISLTKQDFKSRCPDTNSRVLFTKFGLTAVSAVSLLFFEKQKTSL
jgi:hypothetical protein